MTQKERVVEAIVEQRSDGNERRFYLHEVNLQSQLSETIKTPTGGAGNGKPARPVRSILAQLARKFNEGLPREIREHEAVSARHLERGS